jgi:hypothetical protein
VYLIRLHRKQQEVFLWECWAAAIFTCGAYGYYVSTEKWRERR